MASPTIEATNLNTPIIRSGGIRLKFTKGNGLKRLVAVTNSSSLSDIRHPIDGVGYGGNLKFGEGDPLVSLTSGTGSCYPYYPYPDPEEPVTTDPYKTFVVYEGSNDGTVGIDIIKLNPQTTYQIVVYEHTYYCYLPSAILTVVTGHDLNTEQFEIKVYDNRTRLPIENVSIAFKDSRGFIADIGETDNTGFYRSIPMEEGRYEMSVVAAGYDSKILPGLFVQREEPRRDNYYRIFTSAGNTEIGSSVIRKNRENKNNQSVYLDPLNTTNSSFNRYRSSANPSNLTKM